MTTSFRRCALAVAFSSIMIGCGGGADELGPTASVADNSPNIVVRNDSDAVELHGQFTSVDAYLSHSKKVLRSDAGAASASFKLRVPRKGFYELFAWWPQGVDGAGAATVSVHHKTGSVDVAVDQSQLTRQWRSLGIFELDPASAGQAVFRSTGRAPLLIDALRLQFVGEERPPVSFRSNALPIALLDQSYEAALEAQGGTGPYRYSIDMGELPAGLSLDSQTGVLGGVAAFKGQFTFSIKVMDAQGLVASSPFSIEVVGSIDLVPNTTPASAQIGAGARVQRLANGIGDTGALLGGISTLPAGQWSKVNLNAYSDVWTPEALRPLYGWGNPTPDRIIAAWSSFAWDSSRATLVLYGGGHANYRGNDVYLWRASTQRWERGALPSESAQDSLGNWNAIDGPDHAPASAHTYDNTLYLPLVDRTLVLGGAAEPNGGHYLRPASPTTNRKTGPYLFNTGLAHPDKVGGTTGSHVQRVAPYPTVVGGNMWSNRENFLNLAGSNAPPSESFTDSCTGYTQEGGKDVTLLRTVNGLYKYTLNDLANPLADRWEKVGVYWGGPGSKATCAYDEGRKVFVRTATNATPFVYWDLNTPGPNNKDVLMTPVDPTGEFASLLSSKAISIADCALEQDPRRKHFKLWCGDGRVWALTPPSTLSASGWTIVKQPTPASPVPNGDVGTGILGKWKYVVNFDVFMGLQDSVQGNIWIYKPMGWQAPAGTPAPNVPPTVSLTRPTASQVFASGTPIPLAANAADSDGSIAKVEFFSATTKIGEATAAPFSMTWNGAPQGTFNLRAVATDNRGAQATSSTVSISVTPTPPVNQPPTVRLTSPLQGASFLAGVPITMEAAATDSDGSIAKVEFFQGAVKLGESTVPPYRITWSTAPTGTWALTARATDNLGAQTLSSAVSVLINPGTRPAVTVVLQRGLEGYSRAADTYLSAYHRDLGFGAQNLIQDLGGSYSMLVRFAIFQSEGGPVPNGSTIVSAKLSLYKYTSYDMSYGAYRNLKPWNESNASWNQAQAGILWTVPGSNGVGSDYNGFADAIATTNFDPGWVAFDLTAAVQTMSAAPVLNNNGWRLRGLSGYTSALKRFYSSEYLADPTLRPKLDVTYR